MKNRRRLTWGPALHLTLWILTSFSALGAQPTCGLTIITHGFQPNGNYLPTWVREMADAIKARTGANIPIYRVRYDKQSSSTTADDLIQLEDGASSIDITSSGGAIILLDWAAASNETIEYPTQNVADRFFDNLFEQQHNGHYLVELPIHLIGHSRGCSLNSRLAYSLAAKGIVVEQITTLDPHPVRSLGGSDWVPKTYSNVVFADNYFRDDGYAPRGEATPGTYQTQLNGIVTGDGYNCSTYAIWGNGTAHEQVHTYYHGTVSGACVDGVMIQAEWYQPNYPTRKTGYYFSRVGRGDRFSAEAVAGMHFQFSGPSQSNREAVTLTDSAWPNATFKPLSKYNWPANSPIDFAFYFQDADSTLDVVVSLDDDANPFNDRRKQIGSQLNLAQSGAINGPTAFSWTPTDADAGSWFVQVKASDANGHVRYDYLPKPIIITATGQSKSDLVIENLSVTPNSLEPGSSVMVVCTIRNAGSGKAYPSSANIRFNSSSTAVTPSDTPLVMSVETPSLEPSGTFPVATVVTIPTVTASGTYYVWVIADVDNEANQNDTSDSSDKAKYEVTVTVPAPPATIGDYIQVYGTGTDGLRVRSPNACDAPVVGKKRFDDAQGRVLDGPQPCNIDGKDYTFWKIQWSDCVVGWSAQNWLRKIPSATISCEVYALTVTASLPNAAEQGNVAGRFTITRTGGTQAALPINYTTGGTAGNGTDYLSLNGSVTIPAGASSADVNVTPLDDTLVEAAETVTLTLSGSTAYEIGSPNSATVTIADNDTTGGGGTDGQAPRIDFINPNGSPFYTSTSTILINGKAYDDVGVTRVSWSISPGGQSGDADTLPDDTGNTGWSVSSVPLQDGANIITVTAHDASGKSGSSSVTVQASLNSGTVATPTGVAATKGTLDIIRVTWDYANVAGYEIWRSTVHDTGTATKIGNVAFQAYFDDYNAAPQQTYYYWVKAFDASHNASDFSAPDTGWRRYVPPTLASLVISGPSYAVKNTSVQYSAATVLSDGTTEPASAAWSVDGTLATISQSGLLTVGDISSDATVTISATATLLGVTRGASQVVALRTSAGTILEVPSQYPTIGDAMAAAHAGDTVRVAPGNYCSGGGIKAGVKLLGSGPDKSLFDCSAQSGGLSQFTMSANSEISGFGGNFWVSADSGPAVISNNRFNATLAVDVGQSATVAIRNNVFLRAGIRITAFYNPTVTIENNTIVNAGTGVILLTAQAGACVYLRNNIIAYCGVGVLDDGYDRFTQHIFPSYNCYFGNVNGNFGGVFNITGTGDVTENPQFVNRANGDYHLNPASPAVNSGDPATAYNDLDGTRNDRGAYGGPGVKVFLPASQMIVFDAVPDKTYGDAAFGLSAIASSGLPVTFNVVSGPAVFAANQLSITGAGVVLVRASQAGNADFNPASDVIRSFTVNRATLTVTAHNANRTYGAGNPAFSANITGFVNGDLPAVLTGVPVFSTSGTTNASIGSYSITPSLGSLDATNYTFNFVEGTLTVNKANLTITANNTSKAYGNPNPVFNATITGFVNGDTLGVVAGLPSFSTAATIGTSVGVYPITPAQGTLSANNYDFTFADGALAVIKAPLTVRANDASKTYGNPNPAFTVTITGFVNGDSSSVVTGLPGFTTDATLESAVGPYLVKPTPGSLNAPNYSFAFQDGTLTVTAASLTFAPGNATRAYGSANPVFTGTITGIQNGDNIAANYATTATPASAPGLYAITTTLNDPGGKLGNYSVTLNEGTLTVSKAVLTVAADNKSRGYGATNPTLTASFSGFVNGEALATSGVTGEAALNTSATPANPVGSYPITAAQGTLASAHYSFSFQEGTLTVTQVPLVVTPDNATRAYGSANPTFTGTLTGIQNGDNITANYAAMATPASAPGTYPITATLNDPAGKLGNYNVTLNEGTLTIGKVVLTVTADNKSRAYGSANPTLTVAFTGFVNGETLGASGVTGEPALNTTATPASPVGSYPISAAQGTLASAHYSFSFQDGTLTVTQVPLVVTPDNASRAYGSANPVFTGTITSIQNGDNLTANYVTTATPASAPGPYPITATLNDPDGKLGNYAVTLNQGTLTIGKAVLTVAADNKSRGYGATNPTLTASFSGFVNGDTLATSGVTGEPALSTSATAASPVGGYAITAGVGTLASAHYSFSFQDGILTVAQVPLVVMPDNAARAYGSANPVFTGTITGIQNGDNLTANYATTATPASAPGNYPITATLNDPDGKLGNYSVTLNQGTLTIGKAPLTITAENKSRAYGSANPALTATYSGLVNGENESVLTTPVNLATSATASSPPGDYPITASSATTANYQITHVNGTLTVSKAALEVTANDASRLYGSANPVFSGTLSGVQNGDNLAANYVSAAATNSPVGTYPIAVTFSDPDNKLANYTVTTNQGTLTVTKAPLTITAENKSWVYGSANPPLTASYTGFVNNEDASVLTTPVSLATTATVSSPPGDYPITASGATATNYAVTHGNGTLTVSQAALTVTANDTSRAYGSPNPAFTGTLTGVHNGDNLTANFISVATTNSPVSTYSITVTFSDPDGKLANYSVITNQGTLTVTKAPLTITAENKSRVINQTNPTLTYTLNGFVNGETQSSSGVTGSSNLATDATETSPRGTYRITIGAGTLASERYSFQLQEGTLTVLDPPVILVQPAERTLAVVEQNVELSVSASGAAPLNYQWWRDGSIMANATNLTLLITNAAVSDSGVYQLTVSNPDGSTNSRPANVAVGVAFFNPPPPDQISKIQTEGFSLDLQIKIGLQYRIEMSTNLVDWVTLTNFTANSAAVQFLDSTATNFSGRFYRVIVAP